MQNNIPENMINKMFAELKKTNISIFIWGGGKLARKIWEYLKGKEIKIEGFLINAEYCNTKESKLCGLPIYIMEDYLSKNKCNLIVGFGEYYEGQAEEYENNIHRLYVLDFIGILCMEGYDSSIPLDFLRKNKKKLEWLDRNLSDEKSRKALEEYINQKASGRYMKNEYEENQYFPSDIIRFQEQECFIDCGAYHGESTVEFITQLQNKKIDYKKIICLEVDRKNCIEMEKVLKTYENVEIISAGVWDKEEIIYINGGHERTTRISDSGKERAKVKTIDGILKGEKATYIKMDIEGAELKALQGASETIKKHKPKMAICIYHKPEDLIKIPEYIYNLREDYNFYIRNHSPYGGETVLYAV